MKNKEADLAKPSGMAETVNIRPKPQPQPQPQPSPTNSPQNFKEERALTAAGEYFRLFKQYRGFRPVAENVESGADGTTRIKIRGFAEVVIGSMGGWAMTDVKSYPEGNDYEPARRLGWPGGRGWAAKIACIFADFYAQKRGPVERPPYFRLSPAAYLRESSKKK
ncbi:MAG: hypothetical protein WAQ52_17490 [Terriglobales bacterium]